MNQQTPEEYNAAKQEELWDRVGEEIKTHEGKNFLERYALYMLRVQMYELSLKQDLQQLFAVPEDKTERMNLSSIFRYYVKHDIRAHPILYVDVLDIATQRNTMAHEFLAVTASLGDLAGETAMRLSDKQLNRWVFDLEFAFQRYLMLKGTSLLYTDYGIQAASSRGRGTLLRSRNEQELNGLPCPREEKRPDLSSGSAPVSDDSLHYSIQEALKFLRGV